MVIITGRILSLTSAIPVASGVIKLKRSSNKRLILDVADHEGRYVLINVSPGIYNVIITAENHKRFAKQMFFNGLFKEIDFFLEPSSEKLVDQ